MQCLLSNCLLFLFLLTLQLLCHNTQAAPSATNLRSAGETSFGVVKSPTKDTIGSSRNYPEMDKVLKNKVKRSLELVSQRYPSLAVAALALMYQKFENQEEACAAVDSLTANITRDRDETQRESCQSEYVCDYNKGRWPSTLINVNCSYMYSPCRATPYNSPPRETCLRSQKRIKVASFQEDTQQESSLDTELEGSATGSTHKNTEIKGRWVRDYLMITTQCFCSAK